MGRDVTPVLKSIGLDFQVRNYAMVRREARCYCDELTSFIVGLTFRSSSPPPPSSSFEKGGTESAEVRREATHART